MRQLLVPSLAALLVHLSSGALAETKSYPNISGAFTIEVQDDWTYESDDEAAEINDLYPTLTLETQFAFTPELSVNLEATLEPVEDAADDREFEDLGGYVNVLTVNYDTDRFSLYAGKFGANFGTAWDAAPGLYGSDLTEDYELAEMLGVGGSFNFQAAGNHTISASSFFLDTTFLSDSAFNSRGPVKESDGGVANTESLSSFAVALDGGFSSLEGLTYHLGFSSLKEGDDGDTSQLGYVVGAQYELPITEKITFIPIAEYAYLDDAGGIEGDSAQYFTAGGALEFGNWTLSTTYQGRELETSGSTQNDYVVDVTAGYSFDFGLGVAVGYRLAEEEDVDSRGLGALVEYTIEF
ncbi:hypothetical protein [Sneathiella glossodoripedis]|uniref:hypothetical protein n=1 Tax=Sneathiella glossodoripedis TaxID=418853 RepID=UPI00046F77A1|nr:hypothetical protein [Sneathiella glossodoripedis]